ncbi:hypothetical protein D3C71_1245030 [compost metagenome]
MNIFAPTDNVFEPKSPAETVAVPSFLVAPTVVLVTSFATLAVYVNVPLANTGLSHTPLNVSARSVASELFALVTLTV